MVSLRHHFPRRRIALLALLVLLGALPARSPAAAPDPLRPTFSGPVVTSRTTTVGPGGIMGGTGLGGAFDAELADMDGDGNLDLVTTGRAGDSVTGIPAVFVHPGRGDGSFMPPMVTTCSASAATRLVVADVSGDGLLDVVMGGAGTPATYAVLLGHGNGMIAEASTFTVNSPPITTGAGLVAARFDADASADLAIVATGGQVAILLSLGDGTFGGPTYVPAGTAPTDIAAADLESDGDIDLLVADSTGAAVVPLIANGDGTFAPLAAISLSFSPNRIHAGDIVGDAAPDILVIGSAGTAILQGQALPNFTSAFTSTSGGLGFPAVLDADLDGDLDIVLSIPGTVFLGDGVGGFVAPVAGTFGTDLGAFGSSVCAPADLDGDTNDDLLILSGGGAVSADLSLTPLLSKNPRVQNPHVVTLGGLATGTPAGVVSGDFNGDGKDDLATAFTSMPIGVSYLSIVLGHATGLSTAQPINLLLSQVGPTNVAPAALACGDFDGDGTDDIVVANNFTSVTPVQISVLFGNKQGLFGLPIALPSTIAVPGGMAGLVAVTVADFDGDGNLDLAGFQAGGGAPPALTPSQAVVYLGDGLGALTLAGLTAVARTNSAFVPAGDFDGDGRHDLVLRINPTTLSVLPGVGAGTFAPGILVTVPPGVGEAAGDVDGDGRDDLIVFPATGAGADVATHRSLGAFTFGPGLRSTTATTDAGGGAVALADVNGDGRLDIVTDGAPGADTGVFVQQSTGLFIHVSLGTLSDGLGLATGDVDGDGREDIVHAGVVGGSQIFLEWHRNTTLAAPAITSAGSTSVRRGDIGTVDVTITNARRGFRADFGPSVDTRFHETLGGDDWRLHVLVSPQATPGKRDLTVTRPDGDEGVTGLEGTASEPKAKVLEVLEQGLGPWIRKLKYPGHSRGYIYAGHADFKLKLRGEDFTAGSSVRMTGTPVPTRDPKNKGRKLTAVVPAAQVAVAGLHEVILVPLSGPPSNGVLLTIRGPEIDEGTAVAKNDGTIRIKLKGINFRGKDFLAVVRRLDTGAPVPVQKVKRSSKKKAKVILEPPAPLPQATLLEVTVSYLGDLGGRVESRPFVVVSP
jgi:VCBS repeat protein